MVESQCLAGAKSIIDLMVEGKLICINKVAPGIWTIVYGIIQGCGHYSNPCMCKDCCCTRTNSHRILCKEWKCNWKLAVSHQRVVHTYWAEQVMDLPSILLNATNVNKISIAHVSFVIDSSD